MISLILAACSTLALLSNLPLPAHCLTLGTPVSGQHESNLSSHSRRAAIAALSTSILALAPPLSLAAAPNSDATAERKFRRYPQIRFIAALGDPNSSRGSGADQWGLWRDDPGPRGVYLRDYDRRLAANGNVAPAGWKFDPSDWWVEEHGLIMSTPEPLPRKRYNRESGLVLPAKRYVVTGDREVTTVLTVREDGTWELEKGVLFDVTHLPCRSARYTSSAANQSPPAACAPKNANPKDFPVKPGAVMPAIAGCDKQDYAVLFVLGEEA